MNRRARLIGAAVAVVAVSIPALAWALPPANDEFADAQPLIGALPIEVSATNAEADFQEGEGEPEHAGTAQAQASVWYSWTPPATTDVVIETDTCAPDGTFGPDLLAVYTGTDVGALTEVGSDSLGCINKVPMTAEAGITYSIAVADSTGVNGPFTLRIRAQGLRPANDDFVGAIALTDPLKLSIDGTTVDATKQQGEDNHAGDPGGASVWYRWRSPVNQRVRAHTCDSEFDTLLAVYAGEGVSTTTPVASSDDACLAGLGDALTFTAVAGKTYRFAVDGFRGDEGDFTLSLVRDDTGGGGGGGTGAVEGKFFGVVSVVGVVKIKRPGETRFTRLLAGQTVPVFSLLNTRNGRVTLASSYNDVIETVAIYQGMTRVTQRAGARPYLLATLAGALSCPRGASSADATVAKKRKRGRRLWADGKGHFKTRGRQASATVRGTKWRTYDRCDGATGVWVKRGILDVKVKGKKRPVRINSEGRSRIVAKPRPKR